MLIQFLLILCILLTFNFFLYDNSRVIFHKMKKAVLKMYDSSNICLYIESPSFFFLILFFFS